MQIKKNLSSKEVQSLLDKEDSLVNKLIISHIYGLEKSELISEAKRNLSSYIRDIKESEIENYLDVIIFNYEPLVFELIKVKGLQSYLIKFLSEKLEFYIDSKPFSLLNETEKEEVVSSLIEKNQLKGSADFIRDKIEKNILFVKMNNDKLLYSIGLKEIDDKLLNLIDRKYSSYKEVGYAQNNGDMSEYRKEIEKIQNFLNESGLLSFIRDNNLAAIRITQRFGFKIVDRIKSPYSENMLVVLAKD